MKSLSKLQEEMTSVVMEVTPQMAEQWLKRNHGKQRKVSWARIESFAADMTAGAWALTHQGICFGADGDLIDGQHRLHAIVRAGVSVRLLVIRNPEGQFETPIDRGRPRNLANIVGIPHKRLAALNVLKNMERGYLASFPLTLNEAEVLTAHHGSALGALDTLKNFSRLPAGAVAAAAWAYPVNQQRTMDFVSQVVTGEMLSKGDPALTYRRWTERLSGGKVGRVDPWDMSMAVCNCLRYAIIGGELEKMYTTPSGYRALTAQRRKMRIPNTPAADMVTGLHMGTDQDIEE